MVDTWTDTDNLHAFGAAACTHQNEFAALEQKLTAYKENLNLQIEVSNNLRLENQRLEAQLRQEREAPMCEDHERWRLDLEVQVARLQQGADTWKLLLNTSQERNTQLNEQVAQLQATVGQIDRKAVAGLCQFTSMGKHVFLDEIKALATCPAPEAQKEKTDENV
jgi:hypothetical protein